MTTYKAPLRDIHFVREELLNYTAHYKQFPCGKEATPDVVTALLEESARFCETVLAPLNASGDQLGCQLKDHTVTTPPGFKHAYQQYVQNEWPTLSHDPKFGGQGLPESLSIAINEMMAEANWSWNMYPGLSQGALSTLIRHGSKEQKALYLPPLISGAWTGTMCLTESHCGSDLGLLKMHATPKENGAYSLHGSKIFISSGEHDLSENIVHIVLARLPLAPAGTKGISLFIVPKFLPETSGKIGTRNKVYCGGLEKKMGLHGNATCTMNFEGATGFLIGPPHKGLTCMFTFMNFARLGTALQGLAHAEIAWQKTWAYTHERTQGRLLNQTEPGPPSCPLVEHADIKRMLLTIRSFTEGNRALYYYTCQLADLVLYTDDTEKRQWAEQLMEILTPICKAFMTETGIEAAHLGMQCFGGHGYISEYGLEQNVRDARISTIYEGTTYIQSLDLLGRKILLNQGVSLRCFTKIIHKFCQHYEHDERLASKIEQLKQLNTTWGEITMMLGTKALENREEIGASAYDYMMISGYICLAWIWADMMQVAHKKLLTHPDDASFYRQKIATGTFYFARILPRITAHKTSIEAGLETLQLESP